MSARQEQRYSTAEQQQLCDMSEWVRSRRPVHKTCPFRYLGVEWFIMVAVCRDISHTCCLTSHLWQFNHHLAANHTVNQTERSPLSPPVGEVSGAACKLHNLKPASEDVRQDEQEGLRFKGEAYVAWLVRPVHTCSNTQAARNKRLPC